MKELHDVPLKEISDFEMPMADALMKYEGWVNAYERVREKVFPLLMPHAREWVFDEQRKRINGIIDFGSAGLGDPAIDFGVVIYNYGESFLDRFYSVYPEAEAYLKRARFYAGAHEVRWLLTGFERGDWSWFAVHVGSAKDVKYTS